MSDYIYRPPPPPPPSTSGIGTNRGGYNSQRGSGGNRGDRCGGRGGVGGGRGGNFSTDRGGGAGCRGRRGGGNSQNHQQMGNRTGYPQHNLQFTPQRQLHSLPQFPPQTHFNPAFLPQQQQYPQQPYPNHFFNNNPIYTTPQSPPPPPPHHHHHQQQQQWQPSPSQSNPYLSYSQEQYQSQNPQAQLPQKPQLQALPPSESYVAAQSGWPSQSSYGHFTPPTQQRAVLPPRKQQRRDDKPDMDEETWISLNGGKLLGTNIAPPETPEEIEAWIAQRKARFPTAKKIADDAEKKEAADKARGEAHNTSQGELKAHASKKRKRPTTDTGDGTQLLGPDIDNDYDTNASNSEDDDAPPEAASSKTKPVLAQRPDMKKKSVICRNFAQRGKCPKGDGCRFRHERKEQGKGKGGGKKEGEVRKTLYQRLVEHDQEKENVLMLQVIQYLIDKGKLQDEIVRVE